MYVAVFFLCILLSGSLSGLILPMTKPDGSTDLSSLLSHVTLLEQTVTGLQTTTVQLQSDLQSNKAQAAAEISSLKDEVVSLKTELRVSSNDLAVLKAEVNDMKRGNSNANTQVNLTVLDSISHEVKLNTAQKQSLDNKHSLTQVSQDVQLVSADVHTAKNNISLTISEVATLKADLAVVRKQALDNKQLVTTLASNNRNVAFQAQSQPIFSPSGTPLTFLDVDYNAGSAYNNKTSKFTAPVSGTYMFWTQLEMSGIYSNMYVRIMKSGVNVAAGRVETHSTVGNVDASAVTVNHLNKGEEVWVEISFPSLIAGENGSSYFGGVMLSADK
ncbi:uncharacterized protein LOC124141374 isoform X2 [Haliotis rufescens]|uniref:uncharacterized protein LOC124141374 isoform X2 n=1 Tax=Haliotis rufescens TaxID=6454 RepID=UPI00201F5768|nr:uncharacterized protein LOC124141374 isoform X2 [Haliotis rufescens]